MRRSLATRAATAAQSRFFLCTFAAVLALAAPLSPVRAAITATGDVEPTDPTTWFNNNATGYVGDTASGTLTVNSGSSLPAWTCYVGYGNAATGVATVDGTGSNWSPVMLTVGAYGTGTLNVTDGGAASSPTAVYLGYYAGSTGTATVDGSGSQLTNLYASGPSGPPSLYAGYGATGTLSVTNGGYVGTQLTVIGYKPGSTGSVTVDGSGSQLYDSGYGNNPSTPWGLCIGDAGNGTLKITGSGVVNALPGCTIGYAANTTGLVTVDGAGSKLNNYGCPVCVGNAGNGTLNITNGGVVLSSSSNNGAPCIVANAVGATGAVTVSGTGSTWTCGPTDLFVGYNGSASMNIAGGGAVSNNNCYVGYFETGLTAAVTVAGPGSQWTNSSELYVGYGAIHSETGATGGCNGTLSITNGGVVSNTNGYIADYVGSTGSVTVAGIGSKWNNSGNLSVGGGGPGTLTISGGATVSDSIGYVCYGAATSNVTVDGAGSTWTNTSGLFVGVYTGSLATLNIRGGGAVTATGVYINAPSVLGIDVGTGSSLTVGGGTGTLTNLGTVRFLAGAGATAGQQSSPVAAATWSGSGTYRALGGTWNSTTHQFTVSAVEEGNAHQQLTIDLENQQRVSISDRSGWSVGASFLSSTTSKPLSLTATTIGGSTFVSLQSVLSPQQSILGGWEFAFTSGYTAGDPAYLSFDVGPGYSRNGLEVWHFDGSSWTPFSADDLTYDGTYASFTVTGFSGYAVTTVPEPSTLALLVSAGLGLLGYARRRRVASFIHEAGKW